MTVKTIPLGPTKDLTAVNQTAIAKVSDSPCALSAQPAKYFSLLEAFYIQMGVPNPRGVINAMSTVRIDPGRASGTVVTMDANNTMDQDRPRTGYRIDLQHYNTKDADTRINRCCNFQLQTNTAPNQESNSISSVHIEVGKIFAPSYVIDAFVQSMMGRSPVPLLND